jgi:LacI family transcriptional regulator, galactose operon repressor
MEATIRSVAKLAGVAPSTVSHYLNHTAPVSPGTAQNVERAIAALNYRVNLGARSLRLRTTHSVGLVIPNNTTPFFGEIAQVIENALWDKGYQMLLCISQRDLERETVQVANLAGRQVDGILIIYHSEQSKAIQFSKAISMPIVFVDRPVPGEYSVATDNFYGGELAARHLAGLGHRCIGLLCGEADILNVAERVDGFMTELRRWGITVRSDYLLHGYQELQFGLRISELLKKEPRPTAVFATNDIVAVGAWRTLLEAGVRVPQDISIIGFDDIELGRFLIPPLTTVAQPSREIGEKAVELLLQRINEKERFENQDPTSVIIPPTLQVRGSTAAPAEGGNLTSRTQPICETHI